MRTVLGVLVISCVWFGLATRASAQTYLVGQCEDRVDNLRFNVLETWTPTLYGPRRESKLSQPRRGMPPLDYGMWLDPSGVTLFSIQSLRPGLHLWLARDGSLVAMSAVSPTNVTVTKIGECSLKPQYVNSLPQPKPLPIGPLASLSFNYNTQMASPSMAAIATSMAGLPGIPFDLYNPGSYIGTPPLMSANQAGECLDKSAGDEESFYSCAVGAYMGAKERAAYDCVRTASDRTGAAFCLLKDQLPPPETKKALTDVADCYEQYGDNLQAYPYCMAGKSSDPKVAAIVNCMGQQFAHGQQPDVYSIGLCAFGSQLFHPNPETTIAIQCAVVTKGQPHAFVACTGGQLMERELDKCLEHGVGTEKGCFGPNNSIKLAYDRIENELRNALGAKSVAFLAWQAARLSMDPYKMAEATRNVARELDHARQNTNVALAKAARQAAEAVDNATPDITIGRSSNGLPSVTVRTPHWRL